MRQTKTMSSSQKVAVIGAGASGLVAARELLREHHQVVVYERHNRIGGTWIYDPETESDPLSLNPSRTIVHGSLYQSLRTNLPREAMGFRDYPFLPKDDNRRDPRRFPSHEEVLHYLEDFATEFGLTEWIRFDTEVVNVKLVGARQCVVRTRKRNGVVDNHHHNDDDEAVYNAVVVCNGHHTKPNVAEIPGIDVWPGEQLHSHNYRVPAPFSKKVVVLIGSSHSAADISRDIARVAKEVHIASRSEKNETPFKKIGYKNLWHHSMIKSAHEDGSVVFQDGSSVHVDVILHCTGYKYDFPFLDASVVVSVDDNRVCPLYKHIFPPQFSPWISFVGLPWKVLPFPLYELQSKWVARILSGQASLPSQVNIKSDVQDFYSKYEAAGVPKRYTHNILDYQSEYADWLAAQCGVPPFEKWRHGMYKATETNRASRPESYHDEWDDQDLISQAYQDFLQLMLPADVRITFGQVQTKSRN